VSEKLSTIIGSDYVTNWKLPLHTVPSYSKQVFHMDCQNKHLEQLVVGKKYKKGKTYKALKEKNGK